MNVFGESENGESAFLGLKRRRESGDGPEIGCFLTILELFSQKVGQKRAVFDKKGAFLSDF